MTTQLESTPADVLAAQAEAADEMAAIRGEYNWRAKHSKEFRGYVHATANRLELATKAPPPRLEPVRAVVCCCMFCYLLCYAIYPLLCFKYMIYYISNTSANGVEIVESAWCALQ
jgi:hypothetical protein